jgi:hypothetical protein
MTHAPRANIDINLIESTNSSFLGWVFIVLNDIELHKLLIKLNIIWADSESTCFNHYDGSSGLFVRGESGKEFSPCYSITLL